MKLHLEVRNKIGVIFFAAADGTWSGVLRDAADWIEKYHSESNDISDIVAFKDSDRDGETMRRIAVYFWEPIE